MFHVYILKCVDNSFYTGHTDDLARRMAEHGSGNVLGYTHSRRPVELVFQQAFSTRLEALEAERQIKGWGRAKKQALIDQNWDLVRQLAKRRN